MPDDADTAPEYDKYTKPPVPVVMDRVAEVDEIETAELLEEDAYEM